MSSRLNDARDALKRFRAARSASAPAPGLFGGPVKGLVGAPPARDMDEAIRSVGEHAGPVWRAHAVAAIRQAALVNDELTADDVWPFISQPTYDNRALGACLQQAAREGIIARKAGEYRTSQRRETHSRPLAVWVSRVRGAA